MPYRFPLTLTQLSYFVECAKTLNMTGASEELHVAQSAVSTAIAQLERALDTKLFIRQHSKGLVLTPAGERLLRDTQSLFRDLEDTIEQLRSEQQRLTGSITVACFTTLSPFLVPELLRRMQREHPGIAVHVIEGGHDDNHAALRAGRAELAINYDMTDPPDISREIIGEVAPHVIVPSEHPLADRAAVSLRELAHEPLVLLDIQESSEYFLSLLTQSGVTPTIQFRSASYETVRSLVAAGFGYSILNQRPKVDQVYSGGAVRAIPISDNFAGLRIAVSSLAQLARSQRGHAVTAVLRQIVADHHAGS